ncbi:TonB-dependent receptor [Altererythrobacter indicus]|uniref:TonB-dependent receptor n=1 Tax=Altericroceibacterium indicum TaxID=374177 RepID=A0A845ABT0_9SPHN|nr:TonB-dependent receptor [Altericroceibacterium indicum]MXP26703.1 TonB-dependent receptor [Altericroceibacterium indicum]
MSNSYHRFDVSHVRWLARGASLVALATASIVHAQTDENQSEQSSSVSDTQADATQEIVVSGIRASLENAQTLKRDSDTVVDAITSQDIGALPDRSVTEALQRVPGVSITRFAAGNDPDHFSVEGSGVVVRGLNYVRSEFNGRDSFSTNGGRSLNFQDVSPELLGSVEVYKNLTADMIEGGIAGTVNLNTRKPFDSNDPVLYLSADLNYGDLAKKPSPALSGLYSRNFYTDAGRFGILVGASYSQLFSEAEGKQITNFQQRFNGSRDVNGDGVAETDNFPGLAAGEVVYAPVGAGVRRQAFNRQRIGAAAALQYENNAENLRATFQFLRTDARQTWGEHTIESNPDDPARTTFPLPGTSYTFDDDGVFQSGIVSYDRGYDPPGGSRRGLTTQLSHRGVKTRSVTDDFGGHIDWEATDRLTFDFDGQYVRSTSKQTDFSVYGSTFADAAIDMSGGTPDIQFLAPDGSDSTSYFADPSHSYYRAAMDHFDDNKGTEYAFRADATYEMDSGFFRRVKVGARYADRDQTVRSTLYNWAVLSEVWAGSGPVSFAETSGTEYGYYPFGNFFGSDSDFAAFYVRGNPAKNYDSTAALVQRVNQLWVAKGGNLGWTPLADRAGVVQGTNFLPSEIYTNSETTKAAYARLDFGTDGTDLLGGLRLSGNIGLRYVRTVDKADGFLTFPTRQQIIGNSASPEAFCADPAQTNAFCDLTASQQADVLAFSNGSADNRTSRNAFDHWLPSFNLKLGLTSNLIMRFAYSKAISRPNFSQLQNTISIAPATAAQPYRLDGTSKNSNPSLRPVEANQFDLTAEWYFDRVGSLTGALFYKDLSNVILNNIAQTRTITNNGVEQEVTFVGPKNADGHGKIKGFEIAYQQTYDFLPGLLSGLGVQANYTFIDTSSLPNSLSGPAPATTSVDTSILPLEGLSKHTVNAQVFYEKGPISARIAYNWRSKYLLTIRDEITPNLPIMSDATGQWDGSILYNVNDHVKVGIQAVNLFNSVTKTRSVINADGLEAPRTFFVNDRRVSLTTRMTF